MLLFLWAKAFLIKLLENLNDQPNHFVNPEGPRPLLERGINFLKKSNKGLGPVTPVGLKQSVFNCSADYENSASAIH